MAAKQHEIRFFLNAQTGGGFSKAFQKAQQEMAAVSKEIQQLSRVQRDISGYQKQQAAAEKTEAKLANLQKQQALLRTEIEEARNAGQSTAALEREEAKLEQRIADTNNALERQQQRLNQTGEALRSAGVSTDNLERESRELAQQLETLRSRQEEAANGAQGFGEQTVSAFEAVSQAAAAVGLTAALNEIRQGFEEAVAVAANFESSMSNVEALSGASGQEIAALTDQAKLLGATTQFTAKQSADAMGYMAMAGWDAEEMMAGMDGVLSAAAASGEDLAMVSDIITDSLSAFQLTAADTAHFSDVLAATAANANTSIGIMGETFKGSASVAGALGYSIEDVSVAVGLMANVGVKGSMANTALRNTFNGLLGGVTLTSDAFGEYEYSAVKADGSMKDLGETINELRGYFEQMSESERVLNAQEIAGERGYNGLLGILMATEDSYQSLYEKINNCEGAASKMAAIKMDNLNGDIALAESAWEGLQIAFGEKMTPAMRTLYQVQADVLSGMGRFVDENPALVQGLTVTTGALLTMGATVTGVSAAMKIFKALDMATLFTGPAGMLLKIGAVASVAVGGVVALTSAYQEQVPPVRELTEAAREMQDAIDAGTAAYEDTIAETQAAANAADLYISKLEAMGDVEALDAAGMQEYHSLLALLSETVPELADSIDLENNAIDGGTAALRANTAAWQENAKAQAYQDYLTEMYKQEAALQMEAEKNKVNLTKAEIQLEQAQQKHNNATQRMGELYAEAEQKAAEYRQQTGDVADVTSFLTQEYYDLQNSLASISDEMGIAKDNIKNHQEAVAEDEEALAAYKEEVVDTEEAIKSMSGGLEDSSGLSEQAAAQASELKAVMDDAGASLLALAERYGEAYDAAYESISGQYSLWDKAAEVEATSVGSINSALESQISYWQQYDSNIDALTARTGDIAGLSDMIASFADGSAESVNAIAGMAQANDGDLKKMVENWQTLQKEQKTASDSLAQLATDFQGELDEMLASTKSTVEGMNLSAEASKAAESTVLAFARAARDQLPAVQSAFDTVASTVRSSLHISANGYTSTAALRGYASGTENAPPGWAWVGEGGPELINLHGGETILPADISARAASTPVSAEPLYALSDNRGGGVNISINFSPTNQITTSSDRPELQELLQNLTVEESERFAERVRDVITEYEHNKAMERF